MFGSLEKTFIGKPNGQVKQDGILDSIAQNVIETLGVDKIGSLALNSEIQSLRLVAFAIAVILAHDVTSGDLEEDELPSDRLASLIAGFSSVDEDEDGVTLDDATYDVISANIMDAFATLGVDSETVKAMFGDDELAEESIESACEIAVSNLPDSDEELAELSDIFVYGEPEDEDDEHSMFDGISLGKTTTKAGKLGTIVYRAVKAIRNGKVALVNKRVSGRVKLTAKQKASLSKARRKALTGGAIKRRVKSSKKHQKMNL